MAFQSWSVEAGAPALPAALAVAAGILAAAVLPVPPSGRALLVLAGLGAAGLVVGRSTIFRAVCAPLLFVLLGFVDARERFLLPLDRSALAARTAGPEALFEVTGRIAEPWAASGSLRRTRLDVERAAADGHPLAFEVPLALAVGGEEDPASRSDLGDRVRVRGFLRFPDTGGPTRSPFLFPDEPRLFVKSGAQVEWLGPPAGPLGPVQRAHTAVKRRLKTNLASAAPEDRAALALFLAFSMGETADLPASAVSAFRDGGVAHIVAISGMQVGLVAAFLSAVLRLARISVRRRDTLLLVATLAFAVFAGGRAPVFRAALMIGLYLVARLLGRPTSPGQVLGFAALVLLVADPKNLFDVGFLLTFAAVFGLSAFGIPATVFLRERFMRSRWLAGMAGATLGAELAVLPVQAFVFNVVPFVALLSNPLVVPLSGLFLFTGLAVLPFLLASPAAASLAVLPLRLLLDALLFTLATLDRLAAVRFVPTPPFVVAATCAALLLVAGLCRPALPRRVALATALALALAVIAWPSALAAPGTASLQALDVGQGDAWLFSTPSGRVLVDGGGSIDRDYEFGRLRLLPKLGDMGAVSFDAVVLTHPHPDHARGLLGVLALLPVRVLVLPRGAPRNVFLDEVEESAARRSVPILRLGAGETFAAAGLTFDVLHPGEETYARSRENNGSLVLRTRVGSRTVLLTGDVEAAAERDLLARGVDLSADVLKVAHHGSRTSTAPGIVRAVAPRVALIGVGRHNGFGHPSPDVVDRLRATNARVFRTDRDGDVRILFRDGVIAPVFPAAVARAAP